MDDVFLQLTSIFAERLGDILYARAFVKLQGTRKCIRDRYKDDRSVWLCLLLHYKRYKVKLPRHMGLRRQAILVVKMFTSTGCSVCESERVCHVCPAFQMRFCEGCFFSTTVSESELMNRYKIYWARDRLPFVAMNNVFGGGCYREHYFLRSQVL